MHIQNVKIRWIFIFVRISCFYLNMLMTNIEISEVPKQLNNCLGKQQPMLAVSTKAAH